MQGEERRGAQEPLISWPWTQGQEVGSAPRPSPPLPASLHSRAIKTLHVLCHAADANATHITALTCASVDKGGSSGLTKPASLARTDARASWANLALAAACCLDMPLTVVCWSRWAVIELLPASAQMLLRAVLCTLYSGHDKAVQLATNKPQYLFWCLKATHGLQAVQAWHACMQSTPAVSAQTTSDQHRTLQLVQVHWCQHQLIKSLATRTAAILLCISTAPFRTLPAGPASSSWYQSSSTCDYQQADQSSIGKASRPTSSPLTAGPHLAAVAAPAWPCSGCCSRPAQPPYCCQARRLPEQAHRQPG